MKLWQLILFMNKTIYIYILFINICFILIYLNLHIYLICNKIIMIVKNLPAMQETQVWTLGQEDLLEKEMTTHSSILAWRIPWTEKPGRLQSLGSQRARHCWTANTHTHTHTHTHKLKGILLQSTILRFIYFSNYF